MLKRWVLSVMGISIVLTAVVRAYAEEYELRHRILDYPFGGHLARQRLLQAGRRPEEKLLAEPKYQSRRPLYFLATFGNAADNEYSLILDESKGTGRGYDILYVDRNNNENLTDDPKITGRVDQGARDATGSFCPIEVMVDCENRTAPYFFMASYQYRSDGEAWQRARAAQRMQLTLQTTHYYKGLMSFGGSKRQIAVVDYNFNGLFNDYFGPDSEAAEPGEELDATGDQILIDVNGDGRFQGEHPDYKEMYPYAKYVRVGGEWHSLNIAAHGGSVDVQRPPLKLGTIEIPAQLSACSVQLVCPDGVLKLDEPGRKVQFPVGTYQLFGYTTRIRHSSGNWLYVALGTTLGKKFRVTEGGIVPMRFGPPLLVNVTYRKTEELRRGTRVFKRGQPKAGDTIKLSLTLSGQGAEKYDWIAKDGKRPPVPTYRIIDEAGKTVGSGTFEYG